MNGNGFLRRLVITNRREVGRNRPDFRRLRKGGDLTVNVQANKMLIDAVGLLGRPLLGRNTQIRRDRCRQRRLPKLRSPIRNRQTQPADEMPSAVELFELNRDE